MLIVLVVAIVVAVYVSIHLFSTSRNSINADLISRAETIATTLYLYHDASNLSYSELDLTKPEYTNLKSTLTDLRRVNSDFRFIYLLKKQGNDVLFVADSEDPSSEDYSPPGQVYGEASPALRSVFDTGKTVIEGPLRDRWGNWLSALSPVFAQDGKVAYVLGIDVSANDLITTPIISSAFPAIALIVLIVLIAFGLHFRRKELSIIDLKSQLVSIASHELRAPLTGIRWSTETLLKDESISAPSKEILGKVRNVCLSLIDIVNQLLDLTVIESGMKRAEDAEVFSLQPAIDAALSEQKLSIEEKGIKIISFGVNENVKVKGSVSRMKTMFSNLISNAVKYSPAGSAIEIKVEAKHGRATVDIIDEGMGVPEDEILQITKGFFRARNAKAQNILGTGLGLHLCLKIAESFNGKISIRSKEGVGTVISVEIPILRAK